jgi:hypothetical protein
MKNGRENQIGYNRQVKLEWLDYTASLMASGQTAQEIKTALESHLQDQLSVGSTAVRGSRGKTISMLLSIWVTVPKHLVDLRDEALSLLRRLSASEHLALHWGMTMTAYPFFGIVADTAGRMLNLQGSVATSLLKSRMREIYGQRETAIRSTRYVMYSFSEWGVLTDDVEKGIYQNTKPKELDDQQLQEWIIKALLLHEGKKLAPLQSLVKSPKIFPFRFKNNFIPGSRDLEVLNQGLNQEMVILK